MTLDANIVIAYLNGDEPVTKAVLAWSREGRPLFLSTVAETEVLAFSDWTSEELRNAVKFLEENFTSISFDRIVSRIAAEIRRKTKVRFPDAAIAATAFYTRTPLVTRNIKDFRRIPGLEIITL